MSRTCTQRAGGKGNMGMFIERDPKVCAAGLPSAQVNQTVAGCFRYYTLQDEVDALISDSIKPDPKPCKLPPLRQKPLLDVRNAGPFTEASQLINPPVLTKFQTLVEDFKNTIYASYWKKNIGSSSDPVPNLPEGFDLKTKFGKKTPDHGRLYDVVMPLNPLPVKTSAAKEVGYQTNRNYCRPAFNPETIFGKRVNVDPRGKWMRCCLTDDRVTVGLVNKHLSSRLVDIRNETKPLLGKSIAPNNNISCVAPGYSFGKLKPPDNLPECLTTCELNTQRILMRKCLGHLNTLRKCLKKKFDRQFFDGLYLKIKYFDTSKTGWLPKDLVYDFCFRRYIRFNPSLLEPLLATWNAFNGAEVEYRTFVNIINHTEPTPELPKVWDIPDSCIEFSTTFSEMMKPDQEPGKSAMAGLPSGRYFDMDYPVTPNECCKADRAYLPQESDARSCVCPSLFTLLGVSHRDMYTKRTPAVVRRVFESAGEKFTDEKFETVWNNAKKYHSQEWVCYETFRRALVEVNSANK